MTTKKQVWKVDTFADEVMANEYRVIVFKGGQQVAVYGDKDSVFRLAERVAEALNFYEKQLEQ